MGARRDFPRTVVHWLDRFRSCGSLEAALRPDALANLPITDQELAEVRRMPDSTIEDAVRGLDDSEPLPF
jgi:hypothetical protein